MVDRPGYPPKMFFFVCLFRFLLDMDCVTTIFVGPKTENILAILAIFQSFEVLVFALKTNGGPNFGAVSKREKGIRC